MPYFYVIEHLPSNTYYCGSRWKKNDAHNLMTEKGYCTSSKVIHNLLELHGYNSFCIRKIKHFKQPQDAYNYETRFLQKVNAAKNKKFLNIHNNDGLYGPLTSLQSNALREKRQKTMQERYKHKEYFQSDEFKERRKKSLKEKYNAEHPYQIDGVKEKFISNFKKTCLDNLGVEHPMKILEISTKANNNRKSTMLSKYKVDNPMQIPEVATKVMETNRKKYGVDYAFHKQNAKLKSAETRRAFSKEKNQKIIETRSNTMQEKYGTDNWMKIPENQNLQKEKATATLKERYGVENPAQTRSAREKICKNKYNLAQREIVKELKSLKKEHGVSIGKKGWYQKSTQELEQLKIDLLQQINYNKLDKKE